MKHIHYDSYPEVTSSLTCQKCFNKPHRETSDVMSDDILRVQQYIRQKMLHTFLCFLLRCCSISSSTSSTCTFCCWPARSLLTSYVWAPCTHTGSLWYVPLLILILSPLLLFTHLFHFPAPFIVNSALEMYNSQAQWLERPRLVGCPPLC